MSSDISVQSNESSIIARAGIAKSIIEMEATNSYGRVFENGKALSNDFRHLVIKNLERSGANCQLGNVPWGVFTKVSTELCISVTTVSKVWKEFVLSGNIQRKPVSGHRQRKLKQDDLELIELILKDKPSSSLSHLRDKVREFSTTQNVSSQNISHALRSGFLSGGKYSFKRLCRQQSNRYTDDNMDYTQVFIDYVSQKNPTQIKFFDESGYKVTTAHKTYGFSKRGEKCIEVGRCMPNPNITLNCLVGLTGVQYHNFVDGPSNAHHFVYFWQEAVEAYTDDGFPVLSPGDVVIVDNCPIHRFAAGDEVGLFLQDQGIEYLFLPRYSPDLNPCENCFLKSKTLLRNERMAELAFKNLKVAVTETLNKINCVDMLHFYRATGYLNC